MGLALSRDFFIRLDRKEKNLSSLSKTGRDFTSKKQSLVSLLTVMQASHAKGPNPQLNRSLSFSGLNRREEQVAILHSCPSILILLMLNRQTGRAQDNSFEPLGRAKGKREGQIQSLEGYHHRFSLQVKSQLSSLTISYREDFLNPLVRFRSSKNLNFILSRDLRSDFFRGYRFRKIRNRSQLLRLVPCLNSLNTSFHC